MKTELKQELLWHIKNALTKKIILLPFIAPCYAAMYGLSYIGLYLSYFVHVVMLKTTEEREEYFIEVSDDMAHTKSKAIFAFYALTMTVVYWFLFGFSMDVKGLEFLNFPTYFLLALFVETIHQLTVIPVHYNA
jgi:hypothetical protein